MVNEFLGITQVFYNNLSACDRLEAMILLAEVKHPNGMMQNVVGPIVVRIGPPYDTDEGQILTISPRDHIDDAESLDYECNDACSHAFGSCVPISSVAGIELVGVADEIEAWLRQQMVSKVRMKSLGTGKKCPGSQSQRASASDGAQVSRRKPLELLLPVFSAMGKPLICCRAGTPCHCLQAIASSHRQCSYSSLINRLFGPNHKTFGLWPLLVLICSLARWLEPLKNF